MPYRDKLKQREYNKKRMNRVRGNTEANVLPQKSGGVLPDVTPPDPWDWRDRRNYSEAYLRCLDEGVLTEKSQVMMRGVTIRKGVMVRYDPDQLGNEIRLVDQAKLEKMRKLVERPERNLQANPD